ncbi:MAG: PmoA family protein [Chitinophagaceae bacterium]|nr:PmoA family protein [Chitinophagaceae bacterium]
MRKKTLAGIILLLFCQLSPAGAQVIARFTLNVTNTLSSPVSIYLDDITTLPDSALFLREVSGSNFITVPSQIENAQHRFLWWIVKHSGNSKRVFELCKSNSNQLKQEHALSISAKDGSILITSGGNRVIQYNYATHYPPQGVDTAFKRSGFVHPLWSPSGNILTRINAPDHYHHMGIWNPWTHVLFRGKEVDFWNIGDKKGTVRFSNMVDTYNGNVYAGFRALQQHVAFNIPSPGTETVAMNEVWDVRVYNISEKMWLIDFTSSLNCATDSAVVLKEYRYGGFGFRASEDWNNSNSKVFTSEGKERKDADASTARWCMIDGDMQQGHSGILFMGYPTNYNFPEPMRVWPVDANKRGDVFFSFSPTRNKDWPLFPGNNYVLKYRMLVYEDSITAQQAEDAWKSFAVAPAIKIERLEK